MDDDDDYDGKHRPGGNSQNQGFTMWKMGRRPCTNGGHFRDRTRVQRRITRGKDEVSVAENTPTPTHLWTRSGLCFVSGSPCLHVLDTRDLERRKTSFIWPFVEQRYIDVVGRELRLFSWEPGRGHSSGLTGEGSRVWSEDCVDVVGSERSRVV